MPLRRSSQPTIRSAITSPSPDGSAAFAPSAPADRKSTRLNSSHLGISYAVFCLKKKKTVTTSMAKDGRPAGMRKVMGEAVVLNVNGKTGTVLITRAAGEIVTCGCVCIMYGLGEE